MPVYSFKLILLSFNPDHFSRETSGKDFFPGLFPKGCFDDSDPLLKRVSEPVVVNFKGTWVIWARRAAKPVNPKAISLFSGLQREDVLVGVPLFHHRQSAIGLDKNPRRTGKGVCVGGEELRTVRAGVANEYGVSPDRRSLEGDLIFREHVA